VYTVPPCPQHPSTGGFQFTRLSGLTSGNSVDIPQILLAGVLTVLCPVLVSPSREAYRRAVVILVLVIALVFVTRVPMEFPQLPEIPELPPLPPIF
jgi:hypothetical protein